MALLARCVLPLLGPYCPLAIIPVSGSRHRRTWKAGFGLGPAVVAGAADNVVGLSGGLGRAVGRAAAGDGGTAAAAVAYAVGAAGVVDAAHDTATAVGVGANSVARDTVVSAVLGPCRGGLWMCVGVCVCVGGWVELWVVVVWWALWWLWVLWALWQSTQSTLSMPEPY